MKKVTLGDLIDAMEKNGFKQAYGKLMESNNPDDPYIHKKKEVGAACALGQGMLNLNIRCLNFDGLSTSKFTKDQFRELVKFIANLNDKEKLTPDKIAKEVRKKYSEYLDVKFDTWGWNEESPFNYSIR